AARSRFGGIARRLGCDRRRRSVRVAAPRRRRRARPAAGLALRARSAEQLEERDRDDRDRDRDRSRERQQPARAQASSPSDPRRESARRAALRRRRNRRPTGPLNRFPARRAFMARMGDGATGFQAEQLLQHAAWVRRLAAHLVVDAARADDVAQQTLLAALTQPPPRNDAPRAWLASVARSFARRAARSDERRERHESAAPPSPPSPPAHEVVARAQTQRALVDAVLALDEPYRTALLLRFFESRSPRAIAK